jgi:hypothetical protein
MWERDPSDARELGSRGIFAMTLEIAVAIYAGGASSFQKWFIAIMNGFLVYASAAGINEGAALLKQPVFKVSLQGGAFFRRWFE